MAELSGRVRHALLLLAFVVLGGGVAAAQTITGVVTDESGAVLPGVTVEGKSPALIEPSRSVVTDEAGRYRMVNLPAGTYSVTFTLTGFNIATRPGIQLTTDFTAVVNMELKLGQQTEAITVTAEAPLVDTQSSAAPQIMSREVIDVLPTGRSAEAIGVLIPGVTLRAAGSGSISRDVGGSAMMNQSPLQFRGTSDTVQVIAGMRRVYMRPGPEFNGVYVNDGAVQEMSFGTGAEAMDMGQSGMRVNIIPKSGGNVFHGSVLGAYTKDSLQSEMNIDDRLKSLGFTNPTGLVKLWDVNPSVGGPIVRDKLWFSSSYRSWGVTNTAPIAFNADTTHQLYIPANENATDPGKIWDVTNRLTWQATPKDNVTAFIDNQKRTRARFSISSALAPEAASVNGFPTSTYQGRWTRIQNSNLVMEAGYQHFNSQNQVRYQDANFRSVWCFDNVLTQKTTAPAYFSLTEQTTGITYNAGAACTNDFNSTEHYLATVTYIRGAHEAKIGGSLFRGESYNPSQPLGYASYTYRNGQPLSVTLRLPRAQTDQVKADVGLWAQDRWRLNRLTLNYGVRLDALRTGWPDQELPANPFTEAARFERRDTFVNWKDVSPRVGGAYDLFGNGKTAIKGSVARYVGAETVGLTASGNPVSSISTTVTRTWTDLNGDRSIFDPNMSLQAAELGPNTNANFGKLVQTTTVDPALLEGWFQRPYTYEVDLGVQHQLAARASATAMFYHRWSGNQLVMENTAISNADYSAPFCLTAPADSRLPGGGGYSVCNLYDLSPSALGRVQNLITSASSIGSGVKQMNTGVDLTASIRMARVLVQGGVDLRRDIEDTCGILTGDHPAGTQFPFSGAGAGTITTSPETSIFQDGSRYCDRDSGFRPDIKFSGSYELPWWGLQTSATYQNASGPTITSTWAVPNALIVPSLGRNLSAGSTATKTINIIQPNTVFGDRLNQIDMRLSKKFELGAAARFAVNFDVYNVTNSNWIIGYTPTFGPNFERPTQVLAPRLFKVGGSFDF
jgi:hypothetical protein